MLQSRAVTKPLLASLLIAALTTDLWAPRAEASSFCNRVFALAEARARYEVRVEELGKQRESETQAAVAACPKHQIEFCLRQQLERATDPSDEANKNFLLSTFKKSCLIGGDGVPGLAARARNNYFFATAISLTSIASSYYSKPATDASREFPVAYLGTSQVFLLIGSEIACRNLANTSRSLSPASNLSTRQVLLQNLRAYTVMNAISNVFYALAMWGEDMVRGHPREWTEYALVGGVSMVWDSVMAGFHVAYMDRFLIERLPHFREFITQGIEAKIFTGLTWVPEKTGWLLKLTKAPGWTAETAARWFYSYLRSLFWQMVTDEIHEFTGSDQAQSQSSQN